jgi:hypothetical protein
MLEQVVFVVRNLSLHFLSRKEGSRIEPETDSITLAYALAMAEGQKAQNKRISMLSKISIPFWIVQTSDTKSIVLSAAASTRQELKFSDIKGVTEIRRIVTSQVSQPEDVPKAVVQIETLLGKIDTITVQLANIFKPAPITSVGQFITESDPSARLIRIDMKAESPDALKRTEEFRNATQSAKLRVEAIESLQKVMSEKFGEHLRVLENIIAVETEKWNLRIRTMDERAQQETADLAKNRDNQLYDLREKTKMDLRALTAAFSRSANDLEVFFNEILDNIRETRTRIGQKEDDIEGAVSLFKELAAILPSKIKQSNQPLQVMNDKSDQMLKRFSEINKESENKKISIESNYQSQIKERSQRLEDTKREMEKKMQEVNEVHRRVKGAYEKSKSLIEERIISLQKEYLDLMAWTLENDSIKGLMPLTLLDIEVFVVQYDGGLRQVLTPSLTPESDISLSFRGKPISRELEEALKHSMDDWLSHDPSMKNAFDTACKAGNMLLIPQSSELLSEGLGALIRKRIIQSSDKERFETLWSRYAGKCPKCGTASEAGAKFCQKCGFAFS